VEDRALLEEVAFRRVDVLGLQRVVLAQLAGLEAEYAAARAGEREYDALGEVVVAPPVHQAGGQEFLLCEPALHGLLGQHLRAGREAEPERPADLLGEPALREVLARRLRRGQVPEAAFIERGG